MANKTVTVKTADGDYTTLNGALAGESGDLVTATCILTIECYAMEDTTQAATGTGYTTSASYYINIVVPAGNIHAGTFDENKYHLKTADAYTAMLTLSEEYCRVTGIQIEIPDGGYGMYDAAPTGYTTLNKIIVKGGGATNANGFGISTGCLGSSGYHIRNCGVYNIYNGFKVVDWSYPAFYNCTVVSCYNAFGGGPAGDRPRAKNCLCYGNTVSFKDVGNWDDTNSGYNASDDDNTADMPGTNNQIEVVSGDFVDDASTNFHITPTATVIGDGVDLSGTFTDDIDGQTRVAWDIGADEYISSGAAAAPTGIAGTCTGSYIRLTDLKRLESGAI